MAEDTEKTGKKENEKADDASTEEAASEETAVVDASSDDDSTSEAAADDNSSDDAAEEAALGRLMSAVNLSADDTALLEQTIQDMENAQPSPPSARLAELFGQSSFAAQ